MTTKRRKLLFIGIVSIPAIIWFIISLLSENPFVDSNPVAKVKDVRPLHGILEVPDTTFYKQNNEAVDVAKGDYAYINPNNINLAVGTEADTVTDVWVDPNFNSTGKTVFIIRPNFIIPGKKNPPSRKPPALATVTSVLPSGRLASIKTTRTLSYPKDTVPPSTYFCTYSKRVKLKVGHCTNKQEHLKVQKYMDGNVPFYYFELTDDFPDDKVCED